MNFISVTFLIFFFIFAFFYYALNKPLRSQILIAISSLIFYCFADIRSLPVLLYVFLVTYLSGFFKRSRPAFILFLALDLLPLLFFKYRNFLLSFFTDRGLTLLLPPGISFFTFQSLSYIIDCHRAEMTPEKHPLPVFLYVSFFPVISSGPIQRPECLIPQFKEPHPFDYKSAAAGIKIFAWGLFKKLCIADRIAVYVDSVYASTERTGTAFLLATFLYSFQLYADFSGYSDMTIGLGRFFGFDLGGNFDHPYLSKSVGEFWRRWHISLSSWLKDYVYIPLGGSRVSAPRIYLNLTVTFLISGIWHGAALSFVVWGLLHGFYQCVGRATNRLGIKDRCPDWMRIAVTFVLVSLAWVFFRSDSLRNSFIIMEKIFRFPSELFAFPCLTAGQGFKRSVKNLLYLNCFSGIEDIIIMMLPLLSFIMIEIKTCGKSGLEIISTLPSIPRWILYVCFIMFLLATMPVSVDKEFIYFNF